MALKDIWALVDDKLKDAFERVGYEADKDRAALVAAIEKTKAKFLATEPQRGRKGFSVNNNVVAYPSPSLSGGRKLRLNGRDTLYIPSERFADFLDGLKAAVAGGELDKDMENATTEGGSATVSTPRATRKPRSDAGAKREGWSPERRAKFAETVAARKAAKERG